MDGFVSTVTDLAKNPVFGQLRDLGLSDVESVEEFMPRIRDAADIRVLRCQRSGVLFLSEVRGYSETYAESNSNQTSSASDNKIIVHDGAIRREIVASRPADDDRRIVSLLPFVRSKRWVDIGAGRGETIFGLGEKAAYTAAVEPDAVLRERITKGGYDTFDDVESLPRDSSFEVATFMHVFEHLHAPVQTLTALLPHLMPRAVCLFEVRHANDALLRHYDCPAYRAFSLGKQHILLHTKESLRTYLEAAGLVDIQIASVQRYPLANHLFWLSQGKPGGQLAWKHLTSPALDAAYAETLAAANMTDTLVATGRRP
jgi:hypothetical protein